MPVYFDHRNEPNHPNYNPNWEKDGCGLKELEERKRQEPVSRKDFEELKDLIKDLVKEVKELKEQLQEERERHFEAMKAMEDFYKQANQQKQENTETTTAYIVQPDKK